MQRIEQMPDAAKGFLLGLVGGAVMATIFWTAMWTSDVRELQRVAVDRGDAVLKVNKGTGSIVFQWLEE
jgi:hypothetical protein